MTNYINNQQQWSLETFGPGARTKGLTKHIKKELQEIEQDPTSVEEWVDVIILALDGAWRAGHESEEIVAALQEKQMINFIRTWPTPKSEDEPTEHLRKGDKE